MFVIIPPMYKQILKDLKEGYKLSKIIMKELLPHPPHPVPEPWPEPDPGPAPPSV